MRIDNKIKEEKTKEEKKKTRRIVIRSQTIYRYIYYYMCLIIFFYFALFLLPLFFCSLRSSQSSAKLFMSHSRYDLLLKTRRDKTKVKRKGAEQRKRRKKMIE